MIARCDGKPIVWPEPTHGDPEQLEARMGLLKPWRTAAECIDWLIPCPSIFDRNKPLAENTMKRIARGIQKFIMDNPRPFIIPIGYGEREGQKPSVNDIEEPLGTIVSSAKHYLVAPIMSQLGHTGGGDRLHDIQEPLSTIVSKAEHLLVTPFLQHYYTETQENEVRGQTLDEPLATTTTVNKSALVRAFLLKYYGADIGQKLTEPLHTITTKDRFSLVTIKGEDYKIIDIGMRMLQPHELFKAQGFPEDYIIDRDYTGKSYPKTAQVARCGNAVPPPFAEHLVRANLPELCEKELEEVV